MRWNRELRQKGIRDLAAIIVEVESGEPAAYCGNSDLSFDRDGKWVDIARSPRSSGSILKPLLYAAALERGTILPNSLLPDVPMDFGGFAPKNFNGSFAGAIEADQALALSLNIPNVYLLKEYGILRFVETLREAGLKTLSRPADEYGLSLILGGAEVTLVEITACYAKMAACYRDSTRYPSFPLHDRIALYRTFEAMREVVRPDEMDWRRASSAQNIAWKTGTSYGSRDAWAIGLTPKYVIGVWAGNANGSGVADLTGARIAGPVLFELFGLLPECEWFEEPGDEEGMIRSVCSHSGYPAGRFCPETQTELLPKGATACRPCPYCREVPLSLDGGRQVVNRSKPVRLESRFVLPPMIEHFYKPLHPEYRALPSLKQGPGTDPTTTMHFIYPADGSIISLPRQLDGSPGSFVARVAHTNPATELFWHLDNTYLGSTRDIHQMTIAPTRGVHTITVVDALGAMQNIEVIII